MPDYSKQLANAINAMTKRAVEPTLALSAPAKRALTLSQILDIGYDGVEPVRTVEGEIVHPGLSVDASN